MSGSSSSVPDSLLPADDSPLRLTLHSLPSATPDEQSRRTASGRLKMFLVLGVCALPVIASYLAYYVVRPEGRTNYSELIAPQRPIPADLPLLDLQGRVVAAEALHGQWLLVVVGGAACDATCERLLWLQRQLREAMGRERDRIDKVWLIDDTAGPSNATLEAIDAGKSTTVLRVPRARIEGWLHGREPARTGAHLYIVDPLGNWMMRSPAEPEPAKLKRDLDKLLRASAGWDKPGR